ncbi:hypothetical protein AL036_16350 [Salipiger aestuarii]|uniref:hypothetical protein n=1 Tax=Salipiger aestuarii TaxID=568098 RepID=UPI00123ABB97|nr:hypothetical protein [Salipiger aestuarii]KAA8606020.1 hypothetical protein AL036_16350 [Salipiger aestuarii]
MAKRHRSNLITASFHYFVKLEKNNADPENPIEHPISDTEFQRILDRISNNLPVNIEDPEVIRRIKMGEELPFGSYQEIDYGIHFGSFEGAYYGQKYRNNVHGEITAESLNLRKFHYLIHKDTKGRVVVGVTYNGNFGDYEGMKSCLLHLMGGNSKISSKSITSLSYEIGEGKATEIRLSYRKNRDREESENIFSRNGAIAIKRSEFGDGFDEAVTSLSNSVRGDTKQRQKIIAQIVKDGDLLELDDEDIIGCTAIVKQGKQQKTVYFLGQNSMATKFHLGIEVDADGAASDKDVQDAMLALYLEDIFKLIR